MVDNFWPKRSSEKVDLPMTSKIKKINSTGLCLELLKERFSMPCRWNSSDSNRRFESQCRRSEEAFGPPIRTCNFSDPIGTRVNYLRQCPKKHFGQNFSAKGSILLKKSVSVVSPSEEKHNLMLQNSATAFTVDCLFTEVGA